MNPFGHLEMECMYENNNMITIMMNKKALGYGNRIIFGPGGGDPNDLSEITYFDLFDPVSYNITSFKDKKRSFVNGAITPIQFLSDPSVSNICT
jgi:hypothetical protein